MRLARKVQLKGGDVTHTIWRGHNKEPIFKSGYKEAYLADLTFYLGESDVPLHSYCIMVNHNHLTNGVTTVDGYSKLLKDVHGKFARRYNDNEHRSGAVGNGRPKSLVIQNDRYFMNAMFYSDSNPVRAGITNHPRHYQWGSHSYYAFGHRGRGCPPITLPDWYIELGPTPEARQRAYRRLCDAYLRREGVIPKPGMTRGYYIGNPLWIQERRLRHQTLTIARRCSNNGHPEPTDTS